VTGRSEQHLFKVTSIHVYMVKVVVCLRCARLKRDTLLLRTTYTKYQAYSLSIRVMTLRPFARCRAFQTDLGELFCDTSHSFNRHSSSHGPSATAELLVERVIKQKISFPLT